MPRIEDFGEFTVYMYFHDENPPHFHVVHPDWQAKIAISDLSVIAGRMSGRAFRRVRLWAGSRTDELMARWQEYR